MRPFSRRHLLSGSGTWAAGLGAGLLARPSSGAARAQRPLPYDDAAAYGDDPSADTFFGTPYRRRPTVADPFSDMPDTSPELSGGGLDYRRIYAASDREPFPIPAFRYASVSPAYLRQAVAYRGAETPGTIVIDPRAHHLYHVEDGGRAMRYGVGVGRQGFAWSGVATINSKQEWPDWYPPKEMLARQPELARQMSELQSGIGMHGGPRNPLGARAMYLWQGNRDTLFRIHGTTEPWTIGRSVSSGCIRMVNQDAIDLYRRTEVGSKVVVI